MRCQQSVSDIPEVDSSSGDSSLWIGTYSAKSLIGSWTGWFLISLLAVWAVWSVDELRAARVVSYFVAIYVAGGILLLILITVHQKLSRSYELTHHVLKCRSGVLTKKLDAIELADVEEVSYRQGPLQTWFNVGALRFKTNAGNREICWPGVADVSQVVNLIDQTRRREQERLGIRNAVS